MFVKAYSLAIKSRVIIINVITSMTHHQTFDPLTIGSSLIKYQICHGFKPNNSSKA